LQASPAGRDLLQSEPVSAFRGAPAAGTQVLVRPVIARMLSAVGGAGGAARCDGGSLACARKATVRLRRRPSQLQTIFE
jgi:hypothetical protein